MTRLPWTVSGARLHLPRDLSVAYTIGRMGTAVVADIWPLFWGSPHTARFAFGRLRRLKLVRSFERGDPSHPAWYSLTAQGAAWVALQSEVPEEELRVVSGIRRINLEAIRVRNRFWVSLALACRARPEVHLALFRPEWELRRMKLAGVSVVPDAQVVLTQGADGAGIVWMIEFDAGTERLAIWEAKARAYAALRGLPLYGAAHWTVLALVPSMRRARTVAGAVCRAGAGDLISLAVTEALEGGRALDAAILRADALSQGGEPTRATSLRSDEAAPTSDPDRRGRSTVDRGFSADSGAIP